MMLIDSRIALHIQFSTSLAFGIEDVESTGREAIEMKNLPRWGSAQRTDIHVMFFVCYICLLV